MPRNTAKTVSFVHPAVGESYAVRGAKLGKDYTAESIDKALQENKERRVLNAGLFISQDAHGRAVPEGNDQPKNNNQMQIQEVQPQHMQTPISRLSSASQQAKQETEIALLREALAMSAQNCEALMKQSNQSLEEINQTVNLWICWLKKEQQKNQEQLKRLENMNEAFSKSLNGVLTHTSDKFTAQLKKMLMLL